MKYRRFRTADGKFLDALLTSEDEFSVPAASHKADHEAGYGVTVTVVEADTDPWDGVSVLVKRPARPAPPADPDKELENAIASATTLAELKGALLGTRSLGKVKGRPV